MTSTHQFLSMCILMQPIDTLKAREILFTVWYETERRTSLFHFEMDGEKTFGKGVRTEIDNGFEGKRKGKSIIYFMFFLRSIAGQLVRSRRIALKLWDVLSVIFWLKLKKKIVSTLSPGNRRMRLCSYITARGIVTHANTCESRWCARHCSVNYIQYIFRHDELSSAPRYTLNLYTDTSNTSFQNVLWSLRRLVGHVSW